MAREPSPPFPTMRVRENCTDGRDFVVGDVHGEFPTLEAVLAHVRFAPERDRLTEGAIVALRLVRDNASAEPAQDGDVVAARVGEQIMIRRYRTVNDETAELHPESDSPEHRTVTISPETKDVEIIGVVIGRILAGGG